MYTGWGGLLMKGFHHYDFNITTLSWKGPVVLRLTW